MHFRKVAALRGPNLWANSPVIEAWVDLGPLKDTASNSVPGFNDRLKAWLPTMIEHECSEGHRGGFFSRLDDGTYPAHILEHVTLELQSLAGMPVGYGRARMTSEEGVYRVVFKYRDEAVGRACLETARELVLAALEGRPFDAEAEVRRLRELVERVRPDAGTAVLIAAAKARGIPHLRLDQGGLIQLGHGANQRRLRSAETDRTGAIATAIARDKVLARQMLRDAGVPVPEGRPVDDADDAWAAAEELGVPVVVRRRGLDRGHEAATGLTTREQVVAAYEAAGERGGVLVERQAPGDVYRLLVVGGRLVAAARRDPSRPGGVVDVTDEVHPDVAARALDAARVVGLELAGVGVVAAEIGRPLEGQWGVVADVDPCPDLGMHLGPAEGAGRPVAEAVLETLFPGVGDGRIPIVAVTGVNGKTIVAQLVAHVLRTTNKVVGLACSDGAYVDGRRIEAGDRAGAGGARSALLNPRVEAAVLECGQAGIFREGLGFDRCKVAVVTNIGEGDHLGLHEMHTAEDLVKVKRTPVDVVLPDGFAVLKADDPLVAPMIQYGRGRTIYFARDAEDPVLARHREGGGRASFVRDNAIVLAEGPRETPLADLSDIPLTRGGRIPFQVENALAAAAACWGLGLPFDAIRDGLASFEPAPGQLPGRFEVLEADGATVVVDSARNPSAMGALLESLAAFPSRRRTVVLPADGGLGDEALARRAEGLAAAFDRVILFEDGARLNGRASEDVFGPLRRGLSAGPRAVEVREMQAEDAAIAEALDGLEPGDFLLILTDAVGASSTTVHNSLGQMAPGGPGARAEPSLK
jgi:cyanophycin synthetase